MLDLYVKEQQWLMDMVDFNLHHDGWRDGPAAEMISVLKTLAQAQHKMVLFYDTIPHAVCMCFMVTAPIIGGDIAFQVFRPHNE